MFCSQTGWWKCRVRGPPYREYRGIGSSTNNLEAEPKPCLLCLVKIVHLVQVRPPPTDCTVLVS
jgi:hypothetical protein